MKTQRCWQCRTGTAAKAFSEFHASFEVLKSFSDSPPRVALECDYMWHLRLQLQASQADNPRVDVGAELRFSSLRLMLPGKDDDKLCVLQLDFIEQAFVASLCLKTLEAASGALLRITRSVMGCKDEFAQVRLPVHD